ncbi:deoxyuridine 5'-triphosphate nucleotidohydrolase [Anopheles merus]|uniref:Deoxyuridine 5'-triphosphate nucleotidohydrolase n=1 Tax=Anopheles merus TaxID=30066 RepID=A0A182V8I3_ANOME|nr:deoxyuridine 5'-triphosphate nucleotidohydrolase [Anopheles merus]
MWLFKLVKPIHCFRANSHASVVSRQFIFTTATVHSQPKMPEQKCVLKFAKLTENAFAPTRGSAKAAGYDLRSAYDYTVPARGKQLVMTDIQVQVPEGCYGRVAPRSGLAVKNFIDVGAGVVDEDYRGNVGVVLFNHSENNFEVKKGDRIAQFICEKIAYPDLEELPTLTDTERGAGGFGSTGTN